MVARERVSSEGSSLDLCVRRSGGRSVSPGGEIQLGFYSRAEKTCFELDSSSLWEKMIFVS